jgi:pilus assembly protein CpaB
MKRNMVPLLGIAFVVAIISTGIFYGLFAGKLRSSSDLPGHSIVVAARDLERGTVIQASDLRVSQSPGVLEGSFSKRDEVVGAMLLSPLKANEPLLAERLASRLSPSGATGGGGIVPSGMRAVSIRVTGSDGLLSLLRPGSRVDLQAVSDRDNRVELRNILQNVEVLSMTQDAGSSRGAGTIVTVLTHAQDADVVALADAGGKIRVALRNPFDEGIIQHRALGLSAVFSNQTSLAPPSARTPSAAPDGWDHPVQLHVQVLAVSDAALAELRSHLASPPGAASDDSWRLGAFRSQKDAAKLIGELRAKGEVEVVSRERLMAGVGRPISYRAGAARFRLRVRFSPQPGTGGTVGLHVDPEISSPSGSGIATSRYDAVVAPDSSFLLEGGSNDRAAGQLFPGRAWEHRHLVMFGSAFSIPRDSAVAVARRSREH